MLAALALCGWALPGHAAGIDAAPPDTLDSSTFDWSGFYAGVVGGGGVLSETTTDYQTVIMSGGSGDLSQSAAGSLIGGTVGYNVQVGQAVFGVEGDLERGFLGTSRALNGGSIENNSSWDWLGTLRAKAGIASDRTLVYVTAGAAAVGSNYFYGWLTPPSPEYDVAVGGTQLGLTAGAGVEYALTDNVSMKLDYLYVGLPSAPHVEDGAYGDTYDFDFQSSAHIVRAGLNVHF